MGFLTLNPSMLFDFRNKVLKWPYIFSISKTIEEKNSRCIMTSVSCNSVQANWFLMSFLRFIFNFPVSFIIANWNINIPCELLGHTVGPRNATFFTLAQSQFSRSEGKKPKNYKNKQFTIHLLLNLPLISKVVAEVAVMKFCEI